MVKMTIRPGTMRRTKRWISLAANWNFQSGGNSRLLDSVDAFRSAEGPGGFAPEALLHALLHLLLCHSARIRVIQPADKLIQVCPCHERNIRGDSRGGGIERMDGKDAAVRGGGPAGHAETIAQ